MSGFEEYVAFSMMHERIGMSGALWTSDYMIV